MLILPYVDLYRYSCCFREEFILINQAVILIQIRTNKMHICTFPVFDEQKLKWDLCFKLNLMRKEREREKECQWKEGNNKQEGRKDRRTFKMSIFSLNFEMFWPLEIIIWKNISTETYFDHRLRYLPSSSYYGLLFSPLSSHPCLSF